VYFHLCLGLFFLTVVFVFSALLNRDRPRYYNNASTMGFRGHVNVGLGFRPQPSIYENLIRVTNDAKEQLRLASSLKLFRDDANAFGYAEEKPCVLLKLNKIYGWMPQPGALPLKFTEMTGLKVDDPSQPANVYVTCGGAADADNDVLSNLTYYSLLDKTGNSVYGGIPYYYFPYRSVKHHVQPFVLVQFNSIPKNRLINVQCRAWARNIEHETKTMQGMTAHTTERLHGYCLRPIGPLHNLSSNTNRYDVCRATRSHRCTLSHINGSIIAVNDGQI
ncbi:unnamed protein product, partial [Didymodactylos carnosus]